MSKNYDLLAIGESVIDLISSEITDDIGKENRYQLFPGGQVSNLAANVARLGKSTALATCWGVDGFGKFLERDLSSKNVDLHLVQESNEAPTTLSVIARNLDSPDFIIHRGADRYLQLNDSILETAAHSKVIHTSAFALSQDPARSTIIEVLKTAAAQGTTITLDPNFHPHVWPDTENYREILKSIFQYVTITKPSMVDCFRLLGEGKSPQEYAAIFKDFGAKYVVITMGEKGVFVTGPDECEWIETSQINIVDVTGAGDSFWSGLISGITEGLDIVSASLTGQAVAEIKLQTLGPIKKMPSWEIILEKSKTITSRKCKPEEVNI